ncbi:DUF2207 domain-containing protein, partial [Mycobacterium sp. GA-2829]|uniref:DUF2207 domain-containing protein n=1 Tax=Mycobacterium sp. GA-2829 TaxID=1772283 RepID=UPI00073FAEDF
MARLLAWAITLGLTAIGVLWPLLSGGGSGGGGVADDPMVIRDYRASYSVDAAGELTAVETITGEFPSDRHGIFRYWDVANPNNPKIRQRPEIESITRDGRAEPYELLWENGVRFRVAKVGSADVTLTPATHVFEIRYRIPGVLDPGQTGADRRFATGTGDPEAPSAFFWNVIAPSWNNRIDRADITVTLPAAVTGAQCSIGTGVGRACGLTTNGNTVRIEATGLAPRTPVTVRAGVDMPPPPRAELPWTQRWDRILGSDVDGVLWKAGLTLLAVLAGYLWVWRVVERPPAFPLQYAPPPGIGPVQAEYIRTEKITRHGVTATLFHLAELDLITLRQINSKQWQVRGTAGKSRWVDVDPVAVAVGSALKIIGTGMEFEAKHTVKSGEKLNKARVDMAAAVKKWARDEGLIVDRKREGWLQVANVLAAILAVCAFVGWGFASTLAALPFVAFFLVTLVSWFSGLGTRRTESGRRLWSQIGGFHRMLATDSAEARFDFAARKDLYTAYLPFAVAAGVAALWAKKYAMAVGMPAPQPTWYESSTPWADGSSSDSGGGFDSFESALSSSISAYTASQASSSSSSSSSGSSFSGGGGG